SLQGVTDVTQVNATPHALRLSARWGVDLKKVRGSGRGDRISVSDLESAIVAAGGRLASPSLQGVTDVTQVNATPHALRLSARWGVDLKKVRG
ncbi:diaminohydroxyphosphoribosylaminopyrimidine deaminase, partial [Klebsiella pneumoniae]